MTLKHGTIIKGYFEKEEGLEPRVYTQSRRFNLGVHPTILKSGQEILVRMRESAYANAVNARFISSSVPEGFPIEGIEQGSYILYALWPKVIVPALSEVLDEYNPGDVSIVQFFLNEGRLSRMRQSNVKRGIMFGRNSLTKEGAKSVPCKFRKTLTRAGKEKEYTQLIMSNAELESAIMSQAYSREYIPIRMTPLRGEFKISAKAIEF